MNKGQIELLAPAGSYEAFLAALGAGADAVYVGGQEFGARAYAKNFGQEELLLAINKAHIHNKKLYLTVNTLFKNKELEEQLFDYLRPFYEEGLDAVIVQDMGAMEFIQRNFPDLPIHASTQMTVTGAEGMKFLESKGVSRVVAARELGIRELQEMHRKSRIEIEAFVHGALCYCYSGQCLMSSLLGGRSGNRGRCAQPCRLPYQISQDKKRFWGGNGYCPLSLKDMCTIDLLPRILDAGVCSLKIEGRMKQPKYTAGVTAVYRKYLDLLLEKGPGSYHVEEKDKKYLLDIFSRGGSCSGYYQQQSGPSMMAFGNEKKAADIPIEIKEIKEKIHGDLILFPGNPAILNLSCCGRAISASAGEVQYAKSQPMEKERIRKQMQKLGNTDFQWENLEIQMDEKIFIPVGTLNELRREALEQLKSQITGRYRRNSSGHQISHGQVLENPPRNLDTGFYVSCETIGQAKALRECSQVIGMYLPFDAMKDCMENEVYREKELYLSLPHIVRGNFPEGYLFQVKKWIENGMSGFLVRNLEAYGLLKEAGLAEKCVLDHSMYTWNNEAVGFWRNEGVLRDTVPLELNEQEIRHRDNRTSEMLVYGFLPLMVSAQCLQKNCYQCSGKEPQVFLKDRYGKIFPCSCVCSPWKTETTNKPEFCYNILYNSIPYGLLQENRQVKELKPASLRLSFTLEKPEEAKKILEEFSRVYFRDESCPEKNYTKGHFKRGAR